ncbi:MAG: hypothetical protein A2W23_05855 [Planctomycetes bacterium RBG_16_43_13]|nr:MAG: hypothetical protein A2W23_05855 [Planctomycetes bacterium RBG_16_43_13]
MVDLIPYEVIERRIFIIRDEKVMLSTQLAELYGVEPRALIQAVKRNIERFPVDFMFQLSKNEFENLKSQFVISSWGGLRRATPYAFTEQGVAMLSSVLNSKKAISVNIQIMRAFVKIRRFILSNKDLARRVGILEVLYGEHDKRIKSIFDVMKQLSEPKQEERREKIGFTVRKK